MTLPRTVTTQSSPDVCFSSITLPGFTSRLDNFVEARWQAGRTVVNENERSAGQREIGQGNKVRVQGVCIINAIYGPNRSVDRDAGIHLQLNRGKCACRTDYRDATVDHRDK